MNTTFSCFMRLIINVDLLIAYGAKKKHADGTCKFLPPILNDS